MSMIHSEIMRLAEPRQHLVTRDSLREELGLKPQQIRAECRSGFLLPIVSGVFAVGGLQPNQAQLALAACLWRSDTTIGFDTGARYWGLRRTRRDQVDVSVPKAARPNLAWARVHYVTNLDDVDIVHHVDGLRVTSPGRTLADLAGVVDAFTLRSMVEDALNKELCTPDSLLEVARRTGGRGRPGSARFREVVEGRDPSAPPSQSDEEIVLVDALRARGLDVLVQHRVTLPTGSTVRLDAFLPESGTDVEVDHAHWHSGIVEVQRDKSRDLQLQLLGIEPVRVTDDDVKRRLSATVQTIVAIHQRRCQLLRLAG
jgi:very-short-patch-repair endonuclease